MQCRINLLFVCLILFMGKGFSQQQYKGTIVNKLGQEQKGLITVNLDGENKELIPITYSEKSKTKSKGTKTKMEMNTTLSQNVALIHHIVINDTVYYFRDIKYDYNEKKRMNVCVRLVDGTLDCGLFQPGRSSDEKTLAAKLPHDDFSQLVDTEFDYYKELSGWQYFAFGDCEKLKDKMANETTGYVWTKGADKKIQVNVWKTWIKEYNDYVKKD